MLKRLEEANLVVRRRDPEDNRLVRVYITDEGRALETSIGEQLKNLEDSSLGGISPQDRETLRRLLWQMIGNMGGTT
jgi:DNA-binding MarR family transcriptional regulator